MEVFALVTCLSNDLDMRVWRGRGERRRVASTSASVVSFKRLKAFNPYLLIQTRLIIFWIILSSFFPFLSLFVRFIPASAV